MNEQAILALCDRLGTTIDQLLPKAIEYGLRSTKLQVTIFMIFFGIGIFLLLAAILIDWKNDCSPVAIPFIILGAMGLIIGLAGSAFSLYDLHLWKIAPEMQAYRMLLSWMSRGG